MQRLVVKYKNHSEDYNCDFHSEAYNGEDNISDEAIHLLEFENVYYSEIVDDKQEEAAEIAEQIAVQVKDASNVGIYGGKHWRDNPLTEDPKVNIWDVAREKLEFKYDIDFQWNGGMSFTIISIRQRSIPGSSISYDQSKLSKIFENPESGDPEFIFHQGGGPNVKDKEAPMIASRIEYRGHTFHLRIYLTDEDKYFDGTVKFKREE
ncbi:MAG: hypothetical protein ACW99G_12875 [Candidatus Thorarchaeota archaeon]|jgi:hypothetical protein